MSHIVGVTPEAPSLEIAMAGREPGEPIIVSDSDIVQSVNTLNGHGREKIDYISLGCPHYHIEEIRRIAEFLEGKRIHSDTLVHVWTTGAFKYTADRCGYWEGR